MLTVLTQARLIAFFCNAHMRNARDWEADAYGQATTFEAMCQSDRGMMLFRDAADNRETQAATCCCVAVPAVEPLPYARMVHLWNAGPSVPYLQHRPTLVTVDFYVDSRASSSIPNRVVDEVVQQNTQVFCVSADRQFFTFCETEVDIVGFCEFGSLAYNGASKSSEVELAGLSELRVRREPCQCQKLLRQTREASGTHSELGSDFLSLGDA